MLYKGNYVTCVVIVWASMDEADRYLVGRMIFFSTQWSIRSRDSSLNTPIRQFFFSFYGTMDQFGMLFWHERRHTHTQTLQAFKLLEQFFSTVRRNYIQTTQALLLWNSGLRKYVKWILELHHIHYRRATNLFFPPRSAHWSSAFLDRRATNHIWSWEELWPSI